MKTSRIAIPCAFFSAILISVQACRAPGSVQWPAAGNEYEVTDREKMERRDSLLVKKYASILETEYLLIEDSFALYTFIDQQLNTPCSDTPGEAATNDVQFARQIFKRAYHRKIPATYRELKESQLIPKFSDRSYLAEGDLIFFENETGNPSLEEQNLPDMQTVGVYLHNSKFVTCSEQADAVVVNDLNSRYWDKRYKMAGKLK